MDRIPPSRLHPERLEPFGGGDAQTPGSAPPANPASSDPNDAAAAGPPSPNPDPNNNLAEAKVPRWEKPRCKRCGDKQHPGECWAKCGKCDRRHKAGVYPPLKKGRQGEAASSVPPSNPVAASAATASAYGSMNLGQNIFRFVVPGPLHLGGGMRRRRPTASRMVESASPEGSEVGAVVAETLAERGDQEMRDDGTPGN
ncbi:MAG: hypothetical protein LQ345_005952 [Seirophora villosa]|nr:MAG: hypothetical protein LQ345_005952 [Seirophora villosa]